MSLRAILCILLTALPGLAQSVQVEAGLSSEAAVIGEVLHYQIQVQVQAPLNGKEPTIEVPTLNDLEGLHFKYLGGGLQESGQRITIINGRRSGVLTFAGRYTWEVRADRIGRFRIPAQEVKVDGRVHRTRAQVLTVAKEAPGNRHVGVAVVASTTTPYVHQKVRLRYQLTTRRVPVQTRRSYPKLSIPWAGSPNGFKALPLVAPPRGRGVLSVQLNDGDEFVDLPAQVRRSAQPPVIEVTLDKTLIPLAPGRISLGGTTAMLEVARERRDGGFFRGTQYIGREKAVVRTEPLILEVRDAPTTGRPENYRHVLGDFDAVVRYGSGRIRAGDGVTLNLELSGGEVLTLIPEPDITADFPDCRVLPSGRHLEGEGEKRRLTFTWLIKPLKDDMTELPRFEYCWFRPEQERFDVAAAGPLPLTIIGTMEEESVFAGGHRGRDQVAIDTLSEGTRPLMDDPGHLQTPQRGAPTTLLFAILLLPLCSLCVATLLVRRRRSMADDLGLVRRRRASREARERLAEARALLGQKGFYGRLSRSLSGFIADKIGLPPASVSAATTPGHLGARGVSAELVEEAAALLNDLDMKEFGAAGPGDSEEDALARVEAMIARLDKELRS